MVIRPPDPLVTTPTLAHAPYSSAEATRRLLHLAYRDCTTVLDLTFGAGRFWAMPLPPEIALFTNSPNLDAATNYYRDFRNTGLTGKAFDLVVFDPPHVADAGASGLYKGRYGTARGTVALRDLITEGMLEAVRLARLGVLVKVTDHAHGGEWLRLTQWVHAAAALAVVLGKAEVAEVYCTLQTYRPSNTTDPKWRVQRVPRSNGATYLAYRLDSPKHRDFDREYARQEQVNG